MNECCGVLVGTHNSIVPNRVDRGFLRMVTWAVSPELLLESVAFLWCVCHRWLAVTVAAGWLSAAFQGACESEEYIDKIRQAISETNKDPVACPSNAAKIQRFTILPRDLSITTGDFTATLKLKRSVVAAKYNNAIEHMYNAGREFTYVPFNNDPLGGGGGGAAE